MILLKSTARPSKLKKAVNLHDLLGTIQREFSGHDFGALTLHNTRSGLVIRPATYASKLPDEDAAPNPGETVFLRGNPRRLEHFLQAVRDAYPGISFQLLMARWFQGRLRVERVAA